MKDLYLPEASGDTVWGFVGPFWPWLAGYLVLINLAAFFLMWSDKRRAQREGARRIPEKTLFLAALLGGSLGAILGMRLFRHKTKHWYFVWGMPAILLLQLALGVWVWRGFFSV